MPWSRLDRHYKTTTTAAAAAAAAAAAVVVIVIIIIIIIINIIIIIINDFSKHKEANIKVNSQHKGIHLKLWSFVIMLICRDYRNQIFTLFTHFALRMVPWWRRNVSF